MLIPINKRHNPPQPDPSLQHCTTLRLSNPAQNLQLAAEEKVCICVTAELQMRGSTFEHKIAAGHLMFIDGRLPLICLCRRGQAEDQDGQAENEIDGLDDVRAAPEEELSDDPDQEDDAEHNGRSPGPGRSLPQSIGDDGREQAVDQHQVEPG